MEIINTSAVSSIFSNLFIESAFRLVIDILAILIMARGIYYPQHKNKDFLFTFIVFNAAIFIICLLLTSSGLNMGFAFGIFAIFSIIRYRTVMVPIKEMGYFFISVVLSLVNALAVLKSVSDIGLLIFSNLVLLLLVYILDRQNQLDHENSKLVLYERIENIKPENFQALINDLKDRTGLPVHRVEILKIDLLKDLVRLQVYYYSKKSETQLINSEGNDE